MTEEMYDSAKSIMTEIEYCRNKIKDYESALRYASLKTAYLNDEMYVELYNGTGVKTVKYFPRVYVAEMIESAINLYKVKEENLLHKLEVL